MDYNTIRKGLFDITKIEESQLESELNLPQLLSGLDVETSEFQITPDSDLTPYLQDEGNVIDAYTIRVDDGQTSLDGILYTYQTPGDSKPVFLGGYSKSDDLKVGNFTSSCESCSDKYVFNGLSEAEEEEFEWRLFKDPELQKFVNERINVHRVMMGVVNALYNRQYGSQD